MFQESPLEILLVEDNLVESELLRAELADAAQTDIELTQTQRLSQACEWLHRQPFDAVLLDLGLPDSVGWPTFQSVCDAVRSLPTTRAQPAVVVYSGQDDEELAIRAMQEGAEDYIVKGRCDGRTLLRSLRLAVHRHRSRVRTSSSPLPLLKQPKPLATTERTLQPTLDASLFRSASDSSSAPVAEFDLSGLDLYGSDALEDGQTFGHFLISRRLGQGGMSVVYAVNNQLTNRAAALKILRNELHTQPVMVSRFLREVRAIARIVHPNVVRLYDAGRIAGISYLELELVRGQNAQHLLDVCGEGLAPERAARICADGCRGLMSAHAAGILHRDIKPSNLLLEPSGRTKLADFGLATFSDPEDQPDGGLTGSGHIVGSVHYLSPEQGRGETVDARSDVYSLGITFYALLTGQPPYQGTSVQILIQHDSAPVPDPRRARPMLPPACSAIVACAMAKRPADRYQTARELLAQLEVLAEREPSHCIT